MFLNDSAHADSSSSHQHQHAAARPSMPSSAAAAAFVEGTSNEGASIPQTLLRLACTLSAARSARRRALRLTLTV